MPTHKGAPALVANDKHKNQPVTSRNGDTKPCPQCGDTLVFSSHYPVLTGGMALARTGSSTGDRIRYSRAWVCRNGACDYRELVEER